MSLRRDRARMAGARRALSSRAAAMLAVALLGVPGASHAADCSITAVNLDMGAYDPVATAPDDAVGTIVVTCRYVTTTTNVNYTVTLSTGVNSSSFTSRRLASGTTARLGYNVFLDPARTQVFGNGSAGTVIASGSMTVGPGVGNTLRSATHTIYGRIPALQDAVPGNYSDSLLLTLTF